MIMGLTSETAFSQFNQWKKNPKAIEMRNYINNKIAEQVSRQANYADQAYDIRGSYPQCSPGSFFDDLDEVVNTLLRTDSPVAFDASGYVSFCLSDFEAGENLIYFDDNIAAEGQELSSNFDLLPVQQMKVCAHLYRSNLYCPYYRPNGVHQTPLAPLPGVVPAVGN